MRMPSRSGTLFVFPVLGLAVLVTGCHNVMSFSPDVVRGYQTMGVHSPPAAGGEVRVSAQDLPPAQDRNGQPIAPSKGPARQMVYSSRFEIATPNIEDGMGRFIRAAQDAGGYLESREDCRVVCRVPADRFQGIVAAMPSLGNIASQAIRNDDVTRKYQDLKLHIETAEWSRRRVLGLLDKAQKIEDIVKLEEELLKLTATIEGLRGMLEDLSEQIAYSRIEVLFRARVPESKLGRPDAYSPFPWINHVGPEQVIEGFGSVDKTGNPGVGGVASLLPGSLSLGSLEGFLIVAGSRSELKAITPDASKLWAREFSVPQRANLDFWSKALRTNLVEHRGYQFVGERRVRDSKGNEGVEMVCDVVVQGQAQRYMVTVYALDGPFWHRGSTVRTIEFVAPTATFEKLAAVVRSGQSGVAAVSAQ